jgi:hypothetical protein
MGVGVGRTEMKRGTMVEEGEMHEARLKMDEKKQGKNRARLQRTWRGCRGRTLME